MGCLPCDFLTSLELGIVGFFPVTAEDVSIHAVTPTLHNCVSVMKVGWISLSIFVITLCEEGVLSCLSDPTKILIDSLLFLVLGVRLNHGTANALVELGGKLFPVMIEGTVDSVFDLTIDRTHDVSDLEADSAHLDQIFLLKAVAGHFHLGAAVIAHNSPYFFFRFLLQHLVNVLVNELLMEYPVGTILVNQPRYDTVPPLRLHQTLSALQIVRVY